MTRRTASSAEIVVASLVTACVMARLGIAAPAADRPAAQPPPDGKIVLGDGITFQIPAIGTRGEGGLQWWTPDGRPASVDAAVEKAASAAGTYVLFRTSKQEFTITPYCLRKSYMLPFRQCKQLEGTQDWLGQIDFPVERRYVNMLLDVKVGSQEKSSFRIDVRNVALRAGLKNRWAAEVMNLKTYVQDIEARRPKLLEETEGKPFTYKLRNNVVVQVVGVERLADTGLQWWTPEGSPMPQLDGPMEADLEEAGIVLVCRVIGQDTSWTPRLLRNGQWEQAKNTAFVSSHALWVASLEAVPDQATAGLSLDISGGPYEEIARVPLTAEDVDREKEVSAHGIAKIERLHERDAKSIEVAVSLAKGPVPGEFFAIDDKGKANRAVQTGYSSNSRRLTFDIPIGRLAAISLREQKRADIHIESISLKPGQATKLKVELGDGMKITTPRRDTGERKPRPNWVSLRKTDDPGVEAVLDLATGKMVSTPEEGEKESWPKYFTKLGKGDLIYDGTLVCLRGAKRCEWKLGKLEPCKSLDSVDNATAYELPKPPSWFFIQTASGTVYEMMLNRQTDRQISVHYRKLDWTGQGKPIQGVVLTPDGKPAAQARVAFASSSPTTNVTNGEINDTNYPPVAVTDEQGRYSFPPDSFRYTLVALHKEGFALKTDKEVAQSSDLRLGRWARVEGTVRTGTQPAAGESIQLDYDTFKSEQGIYLLMDCRTKTDENGRYVMEQVPPLPAQVYLSFVLRRTDDGMMSMGRRHGRQLIIEPGQKLVADLGGKGRTVKGLVAAAADIKEEIDWSLSMCHLSPKEPEPPYPPGMIDDEKRAFREKWLTTPEGRATRPAGTSNTVRVDVDGSFVVDDVEPGTYRLDIHVFAPPEKKGDRSDRFIGAITRDVVVPEIPGGRTDQPLDLGQLTLNK